MITRVNPNEPVPKIETTLVQLVLIIRILGFVWMTLLVVVTFLVPAVMMWLDWQCRETLGKIVVLAVGTTLLFVVAWVGSSAEPWCARSRWS